MQKPYAIFRAEKIKSRLEGAQLIRHSERSGKVLPANVDPKRQSLNRRLFPEAYGAANAFKRWRTRLGKKRKGVRKLTRKNGVMAVELFMGMTPSENPIITTEQVDNWVLDSIKWAEDNFGGKQNVFAGATNLDETTPHVHIFVIPIDDKGKLNCRKFLGGGAKLKQLQTSYAKAVEKYGLQRGKEGSRRKHIPIRQLQSWNQKMERNLDSATARLDDAINNFKNTPAETWATGQKQTTDDLAAVLTETKKDLTEAFEMAKEVLIARDYLRERDKLLGATTTAETGTVEAKQRADAVLKQNAALVRGIDLVPLATEILGMAPVTNGDIHTFADDKISLVINGRKFEDAKHPTIKGSGAIDLVGKLTGRNFKAADEYLLTRQSVDLNVVAAESVRTEIEAKKQEIEILKPQPSILTLEDVPPILWKPVDDAWPKLLDTLVDTFLFNKDILQDHHDNKYIWATSPTTIAFAREVGGSPDTCGVTLLDINDKGLKPRILVPERGGSFYIGGALDKTDTVVAVANPLEVMSYWENFLLERDRKFPDAAEREAQMLPMVISLDAELPRPGFSELILKANKKFKLATHTAVRDVELAKKIPLLHDENGRLFDWITFETASENVTPKKRPWAWTNLMMEKKLQIRDLTKDASPTSEIPPMEH